MRKKYVIEFITRVILFFVTVGIYFCDKKYLEFQGRGFFNNWYLIFLWAFLMIDMIKRLKPNNRVSMGSEKEHKVFYLEREYDKDKLISMSRLEDRKAQKAMIFWLIPNMIFWILYFKGILHAQEMLLLFLFYYIADTFCVLFWCPFQILFMNNRCCTTCRIFNWDFFMLYFPLLVIPSFFSYTLCFMAIILFVRWEYRYHIYKERFFEYSNENLRCNKCTTYLCKYKRGLKGEVEQFMQKK